MLLAMTETKKPETAGDAVGIRCLTSSEMKQPVPEDVPIGRDSDPKKPQMPDKETMATRAVLPLGVISQQVVQLLHARFLDLKVLLLTQTHQSLASSTQNWQENAQPTTRAIYTLLID